jgi:CubicO group peptidase (beta-lactamase class C family)
MTKNHRPHRAIRSFQLLLGVLVSLFHVWANDAKADPIDRFIRSEMERQQIPGVAIAVVKHGKIVKAEGYGFANIEHSVPVIPETVFQSASVGKQFTAAGVLLLAEEGKLGLDDPISRYLTNSPPTWRGITIRHLLNHTSGIPNYDTQKGLYLRQDYTEEELVALAAGLKLDFAPGSDWNYSNTGYVLLGVIVHRVTGKFYGDFLQERIFKPLRMTSTRVINETNIIPHRAAGYELIGGEIKNQAWVSPSLNTTADGSLYFTVLDVAKWDAALYTDNPLSARIREQMWTAAKFGNGATTSLKMDGDGGSYGCGWGLDTVAGHRVVQHGGSGQGFKAYIARFLDDGLTVILLCNLAQADHTALAHGVARRSLPALKGRAVVDPDPAFGAQVADVLRSTAAGSLNPEWFTDEARKEQVTAWNKDFSRRLKNTGSVVRLELLESKAQDGVIRLIYRAKGERETLRLTLLLNAARKISALKLATE